MRPNRSLGRTNQNPTMTTLICNCNQTMPLNPKALGEALDEDLTLHTTLCRRDAPAFQKACRSGDDLVVACTQESRLFTELSEQTEGAVSLDVRPDLRVLGFAAGLSLVTGLLRGWAPLRVRGSC